MKKKYKPMQTLEERIAELEEQLEAHDCHISEVDGCQCEQVYDLIYRLYDHKKGLHNADSIIIVDNLTAICLECEQPKCKKILQDLTI